MVGFWVSFTPMQGIFNHIFSHPSSYSTSPHLFCRTRSRILKNNAKIVHAQKEKKELAGYGFIVYYQYYTITWLLWAFSLVVGRDLLKDIHTDGAKSTSADLFFFFHAPIKNPSIHHLNFYCIKQIDYNYFCVYSIHTRENVIYFLNINPFPPIDWPKQLVPLLFYSNVRWF